MDSDRRADAGHLAGPEEEQSRSLNNVPGEARFYRFSIFDFSLGEWLAQGREYRPDKGVMGVDLKDLRGWMDSFLGRKCE